jgi:hypothetical protein
MSLPRSGPVPDSPPLRLTGVVDLVHAVPYLVGFNPVDSLVLVGLRRGVVVLTVRLDLAGLAGSGALEHSVAVIGHAGADRLVAVIFSDDPPLHLADGHDGHARIYDDVLSAAADAGCEVLDFALVSRGRMWSLHCDSPDCCPREGVELTGTSAVAAAATYAGLVALPDREALEARIAPLPEETRRGLLLHVAEFEHAATQAVLDGAIPRRERALKRAIFATARDAETRRGHRLADERVAEFGVGLREIAVRDAVWMAVDDGRLTGAVLWCDLARRLPAPYAAAPAFLAGWSSWRDGNGALARMAAEAALDSDPSYTAADLLLSAINGGVDPRRMPRLRVPRARR